MIGEQAHIPRHAREPHESGFGRGVAATGLALVVGLGLTSDSPEAPRAQAGSWPAVVELSPATSQVEITERPISSPTPQAEEIPAEIITPTATPSATSEIIPDTHPESAIETIATAQPRRVVFEVDGERVDAPVRPIDAVTQNGLNRIVPPAATQEDLDSVYYDVEWGLPGTDDNPKNELQIGIYGHSNRGGDAAFNSLQELESGDRTYVYTDNGTFVYEVTKTFDALDNTLGEHEEFTESLGHGYLIAVACKLEADGSPQTDRRVVVSELVEATEH